MEMRIASCHTIKTEKKKQKTLTEFLWKRQQNKRERQKPKHKQRQNEYIETPTQESRNNCHGCVSVKQQEKSL